MKMRWAWSLPVLSILACLAPEAARAQGPMGYSGGMPMTPQVQGYMPVMPAGHMGPGGAPAILPDAYGAYGSAPDGMPMGMGPGMGQGMGTGMGGNSMGPDLIYGDGGGGGGCPNCGGMGCDHCGGGLHSAGLLGDVFGCIAPYPDGGCAAVRWYDVAVDYMALRREDAGRRVDFASFGQGSGDIVLSTDDLEYDAESSFRLSFMWQWAAGSNIEFTYYGLFFWDTVASVSDPTGNLFSPFSEFGLNPAGGFAETDNAEFVAIDYETSFDSFEINFRQRFMAPNCRYQGSCLFGVRYFKLDEDFNYFTENFTAGDPDADPPTVDTLADFQNNINVHNNMVGPQIGGDLWLCVLPGLRLGAEGKAAVLANHIAVDNTITANEFDPVTGDLINTNGNVEDLSEDDVSFLGEANIIATYRLNYQWTLRGGYQFLYVDGVALASENFNSAPPAFIDPATTRVGTINDNGAVFLHGWFLGTEFMW